MYIVTRAHNYVPRAKVDKVRRGSLVRIYCVWCVSCVHLRPSRPSQRGPSGLTSQTCTMHGVTRARTYVPRAKVSEVRRGSLAVCQSMSARPFGQPLISCGL